MKVVAVTEPLSDNWCLSIINGHTVSGAAPQAFQLMLECSQRDPASILLCIHNCSNIVVSMPVCATSCICSSFSVCLYISVVGCWCIVLVVGSADWDGRILLMALLLTVLLYKEVSNSVVTCDWNKIISQAYCSSWKYFPTCLLSLK